jgi:hypothetical protein
MSDQNVSPDVWTPCSVSEAWVLACSLVVTIMYAPFAIAALLSHRLPAVPLSFLLSTTFLSIGIGTLLSSYLTGTGLVVAPAVGMAIFVSQVKSETLTLWQLLLVTVLVGFAALALAHPFSEGKSFTQKLIEDLPRPIKVGVRGGIGTLLVTQAIEGLKQAISLKPGDSNVIANVAVWGFIISSALLLTSDLMFKTGKTVNRANGFASVGAYIMIPLVFLGTLFFVGAFPAMQFVNDIQIPRHISELPIFNYQVTAGDRISQLATMVSFFFVILFILVTDIPGSPYDILYKAAAQARGTASVTQPKTQSDNAIKNSFIVTAIMTMINPFAGMFTSVYYAENHVAVHDNYSDEGGRRIGTTSSIAVIAAAIFLIFGVLFLFVQMPNDDISQWLLVAVSPSLFCIGIHITARALYLDFKEELTLGGERHMPTVSFFVSVSLTIILTHLIGLELALPIGIIYYGVSGRVPLKDWSSQYGDTSMIVFVLSLLVAIFFWFDSKRWLHSISRLCS